MAEEAKLKEIGYVQKYEKVRYVLTTSDWRGSTYVDLREYYNTEDEPNTWLPTKKGVRFKKELLSDVVKLLQKAEK